MGPQCRIYNDCSWQAIRSFSLSDDGLRDFKTVVQLDRQDGAPDGHAGLKSFLYKESSIFMLVGKF